MAHNTENIDLYTHAILNIINDTTAMSGVCPRCFAATLVVNLVADLVDAETPQGYQVLRQVVELIGGDGDDMVKKAVKHAN